MNRSKIASYSLPFVFLANFMLCSGCGPVEQLTNSQAASNSEGQQSTTANPNGMAIDGLSAIQIMQKVGQVYADCATYRDSGVRIDERVEEDGSKSIRRLEFRTAYQRGGRFRFAFRKDVLGRGFGKAYILWHDGERTMSSWKEPGKFVEEDSLGIAVAGFTGISFGTAHNIPPLLMPEEIGGRTLLEVTALQSPVREKLDESMCYRIEGLFADDKFILWIDVGTYLIIKTERHSSFRRIPRQITISYSPVINEPIPDALFEKQVEGEWEGLKNFQREGEEGDIEAGLLHFSIKNEFSREHEFVESRPPTEQVAIEVTEKALQADGYDTGPWLSIGAWLSQQIEEVGLKNLSPREYVFVESRPLTEEVAIEVTKQALQADGYDTSNFAPYESHYRKGERIFARNRISENKGYVMWYNVNERHIAYTVRAEKNGDEIRCRVYRKK